MLSSAVLIPRRNLWVIRLYYFVWIGGVGFLHPFINLFFNRQGLNGTQIGWLTTLGAVLGLLSAPFWGRWSDRAAHPRYLLQLSLGICAVSTLWLSQQSALFWMAVIIGLQAIAVAAQEPISGALALQASQAAQSGYGSVRLWGSLGWAIMVLGSGWLVEKSDSLMPAFAGQSLSLLICILLLSMIVVPRALSGERQPSAGLTQLGRLVKDRAMVGLALALTAYGLALVGAFQFESIYLDQLGAGGWLIGLTNTLGAVVELPAMFGADRLVRAYGSHRVMRAALLIGAAGILLILLRPSIPAILASRVFSGVSFSLFLVSSMIFIQEHASAQQTATTLALYTVTLAGLVRMISAPLCGAVFDTYGAYWVYAIALAGYLAGWLTLWLTVTGRRSQLERPHALS
jgi:PPP family 3-phenylpropionic acid transporter